MPGVAVCATLGVVPKQEPRPPRELPPRQVLAAPGKWPVVGESAPRAGGEPWRVAVTGLVARPRSWSLDELRAMPQVERAVDVHCVTRWSRLAVRFGGVPLAAVLEPCAPLPEARYVSFVAASERGHSTTLTLADARALDPLVAFTHEGEPLAEPHGGPVRTVVPGRYFYKSLKWLAEVELLPRDRLGYWEAESGYHNVADPWREERYVVPRAEPREVRRLLAERDLAGRDVLGIEADGRALRGLVAMAAVLRDARFRDADLEGARFDGANLSNAHFEGARLAGASFHGADVEGADFRGADLSGADFRGARLTAVTFCAEEGLDEEGWGDAVIDAATRVDEAELEGLSPRQQAFLRSTVRF